MPRCNVAQCDQHSPAVIASGSNPISRTAWPQLNNIPHIKVEKLRKCNIILN